MTPERLCRLIEIYGAAQARWPPELLAQAQAQLRVPDEAVSAALDDARALDALLAAHLVAPPDEALVARIWAGAPAARRASPWAPARLARWWWPGVGVLGVGLGGVAAGVFAMSMMLPVADPGVAGTAGAAGTVASDTTGTQASGFEPSDGTALFGGALDEGDN